MGLIDRDAYVPRALAAHLTGLAADTIGKWHARGWLAPDPDSPGHTVRRRLTVKRRADGNLLYRVGDILDADRDTKANPNSRRRPREMATAA